MTEQKTFRGGLPYAVDVKRLEDAFPVEEMTEGRVITHEQMERILGEKKATQRYYGVANSWLSKLKEKHGIFVIWEAGTGLKVLDPAGILDHAETRTTQKIRQTGRAIRTFAWVDRTRLDSTGQQRLDHQMRIASALKEAGDSARRQLAIELSPVISLPKRRIAS